MNRLIKKLGLPLFGLLSGVLLTSCVNDYLEPCETAGGGMLSISLAPLGMQTATKADPTAVEKIETVRILIVSVNGDSRTIEYNELYRPTSIEDFESLFSVVKTDKILYAIANEASMGAEVVSTLNGLTVDSAFDRSVIENIEFTFDGDKPLPAIGTSTFDASGFKADEVVETEIDMVWAAVKFDVFVTNMRSAPVTVKGFTLDKLSDKEYLYPRFVDKTLFKENRESPVLTYRDADGNVVLTPDGCYFPASNANGVINWATPGAKLDWVEWLKLTSEESTSNNVFGRPAEFACRRGWILDYLCPALAQHTSQSWLLGEGILIDNNRTRVQLSDTHYYAESKNTLPSAINNIQNYSFTIELQTANEADNTVSFTFDLDDVWALFRNTHVRIDLTFYNTFTTLEIYTDKWNYRSQSEIVM